MSFETNQLLCFLGSGCGSVGRAVASVTRGRQFESRHRQIFIEHLFFVLKKTKIKEKEAMNGPFKKTLWFHLSGTPSATLASSSSTGTPTSFSSKKVRSIYNLIKVTCIVNASWSRWLLLTMHLDQGGKKSLSAPPPHFRLLKTLPMNHCDLYYQCILINVALLTANASWSKWLYW